ncbi:hypothetical protein DFH07DRAFT_410974 [Mycena maculata]|uniref:Protein kinase domain-containing protein n=1 Tax=Mycena maculata TaxID=230809 RepID=A0AAD7JDD3_9AGAR|nr:hypothetical protein DFH07DRAFT_410974 [Mycena maculata]
MSLKLHWDGETHVFDADPNNPETLHFQATVKIRLNPSVFIVEGDNEHGGYAALKMARDENEIGYLEKEASLYTHELVPLQGKHVPGFYGLFYGHVLGSRVACMLLEFCPGGKIEVCELEEMNRQVMLAGIALHKAGLIHNDLLDGHHFIHSGKSVRIVDFSLAMPHKCLSGTPVLYEGANPMGCRELMALENAYGMFSGDKIPVANRLFANPFAEGMPLHRIGQRFVGMVMPQ